MLRDASAITSSTIRASDGDIGTVADFLFDDTGWSIRWLVVETGSWLSGRKVLLPPSVLGHPDLKEKNFPVRLTMQQVKDSPAIDTQQPVSRQMETDVYGYYGWNPYWSTGGYMGGGMGGMGSGFMGGPLSGGTMAATPGLAAAPASAGSASAAPARHDGDPHLRSTKTVTGYYIEASDGAIGHVETFLVEDADWTIRYVVVDTKNWWPGRKVLIAPHVVRDIDWADKKLHLAFDRQKVKDSPAYDPDATKLDRPYDDAYRNYYGIGNASDRSARPGT
ncbi:MAG: hypothetical protein KGL12_03055 [Rhodospirillales bacterium]|nr:hypothetical protein [Rhodospirillales bacterium]